MFWDRVQEYWLTMPFAWFPFTSPPVHQPRAITFQTRSTTSQFMPQSLQKGCFWVAVLLWLLELVWGAPLGSGHARGPFLTTVGSSHTLFIIFASFTVRSQYFLYGLNNNFCTLHVDWLHRVMITIIWDWHLVVWCMSTNVSVNLPTSFPSTLQKETRVSIKWWNLFQNTKTLKSMLGKSQLP